MDTIIDNYLEELFKKPKEKITNINWSGKIAIGNKEQKKIKRVNV